LIVKELKTDGIPDIGWNGSRPHSIFFGRLLAGAADTLLYRFGPRLYRFIGSQPYSDEVLIDGLSTSENPTYPDQYVVINNRIIWTNGVDRAQVISYDGNITPLGFDKAASTPMISGPTQPNFDEIPQYFPNSMGYSWKGRIGTPGDSLAGRDGSVLNGHWYYHFQYEDIHGNLSQFSPESEPASIGTNQADPFKSSKDDGSGLAEDSDKQVSQGVEIDDLTRRFLVRASGEAPDHTQAIHIFRTKDTLHNEKVPRFVTRVPGSKQFVYDDDNADSDLGREWEETVNVPVFRVACAHQGRLIIGNVHGNPGIVRRSEPGFAGTFLTNDYIYPDSEGAEVTALTSHNGVLIAFTESAVYAIGDDFAIPQPLSRGVGCVAPQSIQAKKDGTLIWLGRDGFYGMKALGDIVRVSSPIDRAFTDEVNHSRLHMASATIDTESGEYRCVLTPAGEVRNTLMFCFDGLYWRRQTLGVNIADMATTADWRRYTYAIGSDPRETDVEIKNSPNADLARVFVLDRQTTDWFGPPRRIRYRSAWMISAESGLVPTNVRTLYLGMLDAWNGEATVRLYKNGSWKPFKTMNDLLLVGTDDGSGVVNDVAASAIVGTSRVHDPRLFWRQIPVDIQNANSWAFEIELIGSPSPTPPTEADMILRETIALVDLFRDRDLGEAEYDRLSVSPETWELGRLRLAAFAFDTSIATKGTPLGRVPYRKDE